MIYVENSIVRNTKSYHAPLLAFLLSVHLGDFVCVCVCSMGYMNVLLLLLFDLPICSKITTNSVLVWINVL